VRPCAPPSGRSLPARSRSLRRSGICGTRPYAPGPFCSLTAWKSRSPQTALSKSARGVRSHFETPWRRHPCSSVWGAHSTLQYTRPRHGKIIGTGLEHLTSGSRLFKASNETGAGEWRVCGQGSGIDRKARLRSTRSGSTSKISRASPGWIATNERARGSCPTAIATPVHIGFFASR